EPAPVRRHCGRRTRKSRHRARGLRRGLRAARILKERLPAMLPILLSIVIPALLVIHCIKTGRNTIWIWVLILLPGAGALAYVVVELLPDLFRSRTAQRTARSFKKALDPQGDLRRYENEARVTGNVASRQRY